MHIPGYQKNGVFHIGIQKNCAIHILFVEKRGPVIYLAVLKKGAIRHAHPYYAIYRKLSPPPLPPPPIYGATFLKINHNDNALTIPKEAVTFPAEETLLGRVSQSASIAYSVVLLLFFFFFFFFFFCFRIKVMSPSLTLHHNSMHISSGSSSKRDRRYLEISSLLFFDLWSTFWGPI